MPNTYERLSVAIWNHIKVSGVLVSMTGQVSLSQAMQHFGVSEKTIRRWIKQGKLHAEKVDGRWLIEISETNDRTPGQYDQLDDRTALIQQLQSEVEHLRSQLKEQLAEKDKQIDSHAQQNDHLTQIVAMSQKNIGALTEQLDDSRQMIEDMRSRSWWKRIFRRWLSDTNWRAISISSPCYGWIPFLALAGNGVFRPIRIDIGHFLFNFLRSCAIILLAKHDLVEWHGLKEFSRRATSDPVQNVNGNALENHEWHESTNGMNKIIRAIRDKSQEPFPVMLERFPAFHTALSPYHSDLVRNFFQN